jgi:hypothetical protein
VQKIPTLFVRDPDDRAHVLPEVNPGCEWVLAGEGVPTQKYDGTCTLLDRDGNWWARREVKREKPCPPNFRPVQFDEITGKTVGWEPIEQSPFAKFHAEALAPLMEFGELIDKPLSPGTYELVGPKINGNPERAAHHRLERHATADQWGCATPGDDDVPTDAAGLWVYMSEFMHVLREEGVEGIVWHHPDGRMVKLKARDFK